MPGRFVLQDVPDIPDHPGHVGQGGTGAAGEVRHQPGVGKVEEGIVGFQGLVGVHIETGLGSVVCGEPVGEGRFIDHEPPTGVQQAKMELIMELLMVILLRTIIIILQ